MSEEQKNKIDPRKATLLLAQDEKVIDEADGVRAIVAELSKRGFQIVSAVRTLEGTWRHLPGSHVTYIQAPVPIATSGGRPRAVRCLAHLFRQFGFTTARDLLDLVEGWQSIFRLVNPSVILFHQSPSAMLAAHHLDVGKLLVGSGFQCPPLGHDIAWQARLRDSQRALHGDSHVVLRNVNQLLAQQRRTPLEKLEEIFPAQHAPVLTSIRELDHFGSRDDQHYWGPVEKYAQGSTPRWPVGEGPRVFVCLRSTPSLVTLLEALIQLQLPAIVNGKGVEPSLRSRFASRSVTFDNGTFSREQLFKQCDLAVTNGTHTVSSSLLLKGKPLLLLPRSLEEQMLAAKIEQLGAGIDIADGRRDHLVGGLKQLSLNPVYAISAAQLAARYAATSPQTRFVALVDHLEKQIAQHTPVARTMIPII